MLKHFICLIDTCMQQLKLRSQATKPRQSVQNNWSNSSWLWISKLFRFRSYGRKLLFLRYMNFSVFLLCLKNFCFGVACLCFNCLYLALAECSFYIFLFCYTQFVHDPSSFMNNLSLLVFDWTFFPQNGNSLLCFSFSKLVEYDLQMS